MNGSLRSTRFWSSLPKIMVLLFVMLTALAYLTWFERKVVAHIQARWGAYRVGPHGLLQPLADGVKFLFKEDPMPAGADKFVYCLAPFLSLSLAITSIAVIPFGPKDFMLFGQSTPMGIANLNVGLLVLFAITSMSVYGVALAGWASNSKYPLLGALRSSAQMVSYEVALTMSVVGVILMAGTFNLSEIVNSQQGSHWGFVPRWSLIGSPMPQVLGFVLFFTSAVAKPIAPRSEAHQRKRNRSRSRGFHTELPAEQIRDVFYGRIREHDRIVSCLATILFFGGWLFAISANPPAFGWTHYIPTAAFAIAGLALIIHGVATSQFWDAELLPGVGDRPVCAGSGNGQPWIIEFAQGPFWFSAENRILSVRVCLGARHTSRFRYDPIDGFRLEAAAAAFDLNVVITVWRLY